MTSKLRSFLTFHVAGQVSYKMACVRNMVLHSQKHTFARVEPDGNGCRWPEFVILDRPAVSVDHYDGVDAS